MGLLLIFFCVLTGVQPTTNCFVFFQAGSGQLLSNFVIFIAEKLIYVFFVITPCMDPKKQAGVPDWACGSSRVEP